MSSRLDFKRITRPEILKKIDPDRLRAFLRELAGDYVDAAGVLGDPLRYDEIAELLATPGGDYPDALADALHYAADFAKDRNAYEALLDAATTAGLATVRDDTGVQMTAEDLVIALWLDGRGQPLVRRVHAQHCSANPRSFESFYPKDEAADVPGDFGPDALAGMVRDLDAFYDERRNARGVRIIPVVKGTSVWLIVRQPAPWERRVYVVDDGGDDMKHGHPEDYDVLIYQPQRRELSVHAKSKSEAAKYREVVGHHAFRDRDRFSEAGRVSLDPLRTLGRDSLIVDHIDGIHAITLVEIGFQWRNAVNDKMTRRSDDLFVTFDGRPMPRAHIRYAVFDVVYRKGQPGSAVRVYAGARTSYGRESAHDCVKDWLVDRGFLRVRGRVPAQALASLWRALADDADSVLARAEWDALLGEGAGPAAGLLALAGGPAATRRCGAGPGQGCRMNLVGTDDDGNGIYRCGDDATRCDGSVVSKGKAAGYRINVDGVAQLLADAVGAEGEPARLPEDGIRLWTLGTRVIGGHQIAFWFTTGVDEAPVSASVTAARARASTPLACLLLPSLSALPGRVLDAARGAGVFLLPLDDAGSVDGSALTVDLWPLLDRYRRELRGADPTEFSRDRFDLVLDPAGERYWCFGRPVSFGEREQASRLLLRMLAARPGTAVSFEQMQAAHPSVVAPSSRPSWPQYRQKLMKAIRAMRRKGDPELADDLIDSVAGGAYVLRLESPRVEWWSREEPPDGAG